jgi:trehalose/maltose hydrolase-like predicted phosphorylase
VTTSNGGATYGIDGVTGPDEYANNIDDDAATDAGAVVSLRDAIAAAQLVGATPPSSWQQVANGLTATITDMQGPNSSHPEYQGYTDGIIKQADAILMTYPFGYVTSNGVAEADPDRYAPVTDPGGPAMTDGVESIIAAQIGSAGCDDYTYLQESVGPFTEGSFDQPFEFRTLATDSGQGAFDFLTGAGGFLQTFPYGLAGLRWHANGLHLNPTLPPAAGQQRRHHQRPAIPGAQRLDRDRREHHDREPGGRRYRVADRHGPVGNPGHGDRLRAADPGHPAPGPDPDDGPGAVQAGHIELHLARLGCAGL